MAIWIPALGCECTECGPDPCTPGCACTFTASEFGDTGGSYVYDVTGQFVFESDLSITFVAPAPTATARLQVYADGVSVYDSGCISTGASATVAIPAGTTEIEAVVTICVSTGEDDWSFDLACV